MKLARAKQLSFKIVSLFTCCLVFAACLSFIKKEKTRIIISTDIGGTDPDDFQSMIHFFMYADVFQVEGLIASPYGKGRATDILNMIDLYEQDYPKLSKHSKTFPTPNHLRTVTKQGSTETAPYKGYQNPTEGSEWIITCAKKTSDNPLWILVWGGLEDLAQALHDAPGIEKNIRVYWIGGPNKKWSANAYHYIAKNHPNLYMIEANSTYRGIFIDNEAEDHIKNINYYNNYIQGFGALGQNFKTHYNGFIKMGDTPSLFYVLNGNPNNPTSASWGGKFETINRSSNYLFQDNTTIKDTVATFGIIEWHFKGPDLNIDKDTSCFKLTISGQPWSGYYLGNGTYAVRYVSKKPEVCSYETFSNIPQLNGLKGQFVSTISWPGKPTVTDLKLGKNWYSDKSDAHTFLGEHQGAKTIAIHRKDFLLDWTRRWFWLK